MSLREIVAVMDGARELYPEMEIRLKIEGQSGELAMILPLEGDLQIGQRTGLIPIQNLAEEAHRILRNIRFTMEFRLENP